MLTRGVSHIRSGRQTSFWGTNHLTKNQTKYCSQQLFKMYVVWQQTVYFELKVGYEWCCIWEGEMLLSKWISFTEVHVYKFLNLVEPARTILQTTSQRMAKNYWVCTTLCPSSQTYARVKSGTGVGFCCRWLSWWFPFDASVHGTVIQRWHKGKLWFWRLQVDQSTEHIYVSTFLSNLHFMFAHIVLPGLKSSSVVIRTKVILTPKLGSGPWN